MTMRHGMRNLALPAELSLTFHPKLFSKPGRRCLDVPDQIGQGDGRFLADQQMQMVRHVVDRDELLALVGHNAGDVFLQFIIP